MNRTIGQPTTEQPTDDDVKQAVWQAAQLQTQMLRRITNAGAVGLALVLCIVVAWAGGWVVDAIR